MRGIYILGSVILISLISFIGVIFISVKEKFLQQILHYLVSFATGALLGSAFFHLLPESVEILEEKTFWLVVVSFLFFFILEKFLHWRHCHLGHCEEHAFIYLNLLGDGVHNFLDGAVVAAAFLNSISLGVTTALAVVFHEIPQEIGDFSVLIYGGMKKNKALLLNFASAFAAILGALGVYFFNHYISDLIPFFLPFAAGSFLYIAGTDLIPELHKKESFKESFFQFLCLSLGLGIMFGLKYVLEP